jgi:hypothetical protein
MLAALRQIDPHGNGYASPAAERLAFSPALVLRRESATSKRVVGGPRDERTPAFVRSPADPHAHHAIRRDVANPVCPFAATGQEIEPGSAGIGTEPELDATLLSSDAPGRLQVAEVLLGLVVGEDRRGDLLARGLAPLD